MHLLRQHFLCFSLRTQPPTIQMNWIWVMNIFCLIDPQNLMINRRWVQRGATKYIERKLWPKEMFSVCMNAEKKNWNIIMMQKRIININLFLFRLNAVTFLCVSFNEYCLYLWSLPNTRKIKQWPMNIQFNDTCRRERARRGNDWTNERKCEITLTKIWNERKYCLPLVLNLFYTLHIL